jgi:hypothetical protein
MADERDEWIRAALERAPVPEQSPRFFADLWEAAQARERAAARRWRRVSLVLALVAAAAVSSAAVLAASPRSTSATVDVRGVCAAQEQGGIPAFIVGAIVSGPRKPGKPSTVKPPPGFHVDPTAWITTTPGFVPDTAPVFSFSTQASGYQLDRRSCPPTSASIPLAREGLGNPVHLDAKSLRLVVRCLGPARFAFRARITNDRYGVPIRAQIAAANARTGKQLVYIAWSPTRVDGWSAASCE